MTDFSEPDLRATPSTSTGQCAIVAAANHHDRFKLLQDDGVRPANLENAIHPIFDSFDTDGPMRQALQLASQFIAQESVLTFFVPLIRGGRLTATIDGKHKTCLRNPLRNASDETKKELLGGVREALLCLAHSVQFSWFKDDSDRILHAKTRSQKARSVHKPSCCKFFQQDVTPKIEVNERFREYYEDWNGYLAATRCAQFRHDFVFATTIVHELTHAVGIMRRGDTSEEQIRYDHHDEVEWGYAWEHFMFGCIINPQTKDKSGTGLLLRKVWADSRVAENNYGKEYGTVPMAYVAQWFRQETWDIVARRGPLAVPEPRCDFKVQAWTGTETQYGAWIITTDKWDVIEADVRALYSTWKHEEARRKALGISSRSSNEIKRRMVSTEQMGQHNVPLAPRDPRGPQAGAWKPHESELACATTSETAETSSSVKVMVSSPTSGIKRRRTIEDTDDTVCDMKMVKKVKQDTASALSKA